MEAYHRNQKQDLIDRGVVFKEDYDGPFNPKVDDNGQEIQEEKTSKDKASRENKKFEKKLEIREKKVNDALSSNRSKYGSKLDIDSITKEIYEDPKIIKEIN